MGTFFKRNIVPQLLPSRLLCMYYQCQGIRVGGGTEIRRQCFFDYGKVSIGERCFINVKCEFHAGIAKISIGDKVQLAMGVCLCCHTHEINGSSARAQETIYGDITIGDGSWLGARVTVLPNVTIGKGCVIAAGSVVIKDCEDNWLYAGVPARKVKFLGDN